MGLWKSHYKQTSSNFLHKKKETESKGTQGLPISDHESTDFLGLAYTGFYFYLDSENVDDVVRSFSPLYWLVFLFEVQEGMDKQSIYQLHKHKCSMPVTPCIPTSFL